MKLCGMKGLWIMITCTFLLTITPTQKSHAVVWVVIKTAVKKVIKAMDLMVQRLQNQTIKLQNAQKAIENAMSKLKLKEISEWGEKQRELFNKYYDELWRVKTAIAYYKRIREMLDRQASLVAEYKRAWDILKTDKHFTSGEISFMYDVYSGILDESLKNLDEILLVVNSFSTQMSDAKRLELVHAASVRIDQNLSHLRQFTNGNIMLSMQRTKDASELLSVKAMYGIEQ